MFNHQQVQSYQKITAPTELKQIVLSACENQKYQPVYPKIRVIYGVIPVVACLLFFIGIFTMSQKEPLTLSIDTTPVSSQGMTLPGMVANASRLRTFSPQPSVYTINLSTNQNVQIVSAQGNITFTEDGLQWEVTIPDNDTLFELFLQAEDGTYYVPLRYHVNDGSFSIRCEKMNQ